MKTILAAVLLLLGVAAARAEWVKMGETGDAVFYVDPASIMGKGDLRRVSAIHDLAQPGAGGVRSRLVLYEVDCGGSAIRSVSATEHAEPMAKGARVAAWERESDWLYVTPRTGTNITPRTPYAAIVRRVCA